MDNENKNKNSMREDREEVQTIKTKIYNYFYFILKDKKEINRASSCIFIIFEMIQLLSFSFADPNKETWKISEKKMKLISSIIGAPRIAPLMRWVSYDIYIIIFFIIVVLMFCLCLLMTMQVLFANPSSKIYRIGVSFVRHFINPLTILLTIPVMELVLMPLKCKGGKVDTVKDGIECWKKMHYLYAVLGIVVNIMFVPIIFIMIMFYFSPFQIRNSTTKISGERDSFLFIIKLVFILQHLLIKNQYVSVVITLLLSTYNFVSQYSEPTYNNFVLQIFVHIRNSVVFWTYFVLFIGKLLYNTRVDGIAYLLLFGYPVIMYFSYVYYKKIEEDFKYTSANFNNIKDYMEKTRYMVKLVESYIDNGKGLRYGRELVNQKNDILLKGLINNHEEQCIDDDCPMKKFLENSGNYNVQKLCLLNHMNNHFTFGIKQFPESRELLIAYIQFNYSKKFNLNSVRTHLGKVQRLTNSVIQDFIIFSMEQDIKRIKNKFGDGESDAEQELDAMAQKYQRLKFLIENSTKLYGEFWGIFATNVTNNLNTIKLYSLGEKLNKYLNEINDIWENQLKGKKIELENQSVAQLYSRFLKEILWDKKRSEEIQKKLNDEHHRHHEAKKIMEEGPNVGNFDYILENQDYVIFANSNEKGLCNIVQCSNSIVYLLGYLKKDIIGKSIEFIMPSIFVDGHAKMLEGHIKKMHSHQNSQRDSFRASDKKETFLLPKSKMGYLSPLNAKFTVYDDNDFSNNFVIKVKMEAKDTKSVYAYYVLTKPDFSIDSISSSALNLGLSMDLLKKYVVKMSVLVRDQTKEINFIEELKNFEEEPKEVTWIFPEIIYPKNDSQRSREDILEQLIEKSPKKQISLQITPMKYDANLIGYVFKFTELNQKKIQSELNKVNNITKNDLIQFNEKKEVLFDVKRLGYIRTVLVEQKTGFHNLREEEMEKDQSDDSLTHKKKLIDSKEDEIHKEDSDEDQKMEEMAITKEKILELQQRDSAGVKSFIVQLPFYGSDVAVEKHRPNGEKYPAGRAQLASITIDIGKFEESIKKKIRDSPELMKRLREGNKDEAGNSALANAAGEDNHQSGKTAEELSREFSSDTSSSLANIFNAKSITYIKSVNIIIFLVVCAFITLEFILSYLHIQNINDYRYYMDNGYKLLHNLLYTKYFLTEAMACNAIDHYLGFDKDEYIKRMNAELSVYRGEYVNLYNSYSSATVSFNDDYKRVTNSNITKRSISISTKQQTISNHSFSTEMNQISTAVYFVSTSMNYTITMNMEEERYAYELMANLLNGYYSKWGEVTKILVDNVKEHCSKTSSSSSIHILIFILSIVVSVAFLILFWKVLIIFIEDRERPINLFLTIKKKIFEDLKNSAEGFSNKLLNKVFGNEDNDEESQQDYQANIKVNDINIIKFKAKNEYKTSVNKDKTHLLNYLKLVIFFLVFLVYMSFKFGYFILNIESMSYYIDVYNITQICQTNTLYTVDVIKSYLFNSKIQILDGIDNKDIFINTYKSMSDALEQMIIETSRTTSFLSGEYQDKFREYLNSDFTVIISKPDEKYLTYYKEGLKKSIMRQYDILKYISLRRLTLDITNAKSDNKLLNETEWIELNDLVENIIRPWFIGLVATLNTRFEDFYDGTRLVQISVFISLLVVIILVYFIIWRNYEESLKSLLKISFDLINLIPEEIKYLIVLKINE